jgi:ubiquinone/menaquinone biosynthesis C-methylase UbiE
VKGRKVLDVGCGTGAFDFYLANKGFEVTGVDVSRNAITSARENASRFGLSERTRFYTSPFLKFNLKRKFDIVICSEVLEHLKNDKGVVNKIFKLLNPGGICVFSSPSVNSVVYKFGMAKEFDKKVGHLRRYSVPDFYGLVSEAGFDIVRLKKNQGFLRDVFFIFPFGDLIIRAANRFGFVSDLLTLVDNLFLPLGEAQIIILAKR